jgi:oxygen-independent coproporphyrinogen-3 oxidase
LIAGGTRYHAHFVPDEDLMADLYLMACERLQAAGVAQYEISNFAREDCRSLHNLKYWTRQPYLGFGVDAHSMLPVGAPRREEGIDSIRIASPDSLEAYLAGGQRMVAQITHQAAVEESLFLGLRLTQGIDLRSIAAAFGGEALSQFQSAIGSFVEAGLLERQGDRLRLTSRGRLLSNEVFAAFVAEPQVPHPTETEV